MDDTVFRLFFWTGPIGIGFFLISIGAMLLMLAKAEEIDQRAKRLKQKHEKKDHGRGSTQGEE